MIIKSLMLSLIIITTFLLIIISSKVDRNWFLLFCIKGFILVGSFICCRIVVLIHFMSYSINYKLNDQNIIIKLFKKLTRQQLLCNTFIILVAMFIIIIAVLILILYVYICVKYKYHTILAPMIINVLPLSIFYTSMIDDVLYNKIENYISMPKIKHMPKDVKNSYTQDNKNIINEKTRLVIISLSIIIFIVFILYTCYKRYCNKTNNKNNMIYMSMTILISVIVGMLLTFFALYLSNNNNFGVKELLINYISFKGPWIQNMYMVDVICQLGFIFVGISDMIFLYKLNKKSNKS